MKKRSHHEDYSLFQQLKNRRRHPQKAATEKGSGTVALRGAVRSGLEAITLVGVLSPPLTTVALSVALVMRWTEFGHPIVSLASGASILFFVLAVLLAHFLQSDLDGGLTVGVENSSERRGRSDLGEHHSRS